PPFHVALDDLIDLPLDHGRSARTNQIDPGLCFVDADDSMPAVGETGCTNGSHVAKSEHTDPHDLSLVALELLLPFATRAGEQPAHGAQEFPATAAQLSELGVGAEQLRLLMVPGKRVFHALAAILAHEQAPL